VSIGLKKKVLVAENSELEREILTTLLSDKYEANYVSSGTQAVTAAKIFLPDLIIMDVYLPEQNGYDACKEIRLGGFEGPIIFFSSLEEIEDKIKALEAGGDDFIGKPYDIKEMLLKIERNMQRVEKERQYRETNEQVMAMANRSMVDLSQLGRIMTFLQNINKCRNFDDLANKTFKLLKELNLKSSLLIHSIDEDRIYFDDEIHKPIEHSLLQALAGQRRIYEFAKRRCAYNWQKVTLVIKNMPTDEVENGAMKDYIGYVMNGIEEVVNSLVLQMELKKAIHSYKEGNKQLKLSIMKVIEDFEESLIEMFERPDVAAALPVDVEDLVLGLFNKSRQQADDHFNSGLSMEAQLEDVLELFSQNQAEEETAQDDPFDDDDAIMLF